MDMKVHGISIGIENHGDSDFVLFIKATGTLTHEDYEYMVPMLEAAVDEVKQPQLFVLADLTDFDGWEMRAMWDDLKLGIEHGREFKKIAILGSRGWHEWMARVADWFTPSAVKFFEDRQEAVNWLRQ
ncbi:STAS/SEC14 domain-containing protein [Shewanella sp. YIC-542]|uniref:STAS/SEC14 domain-containing protein n=1 Tax=Shewanella mytili TaxID=3377111 RepID=UPI00398F783B